MTKFSLILLILFSFTAAVGQELREMTVVGKPRKLDSGEIVARRDQNGNFCAAVQIISDMDGFRYDSYDGIVGNIDDNPGKDIVYLTPTERVLEVLKIGYKPLKIILSEYGIMLKSTEIWQIEIAGDKTENLLPVTLHFSPEDALLTIDEKPAENAGTFSLSTGKHAISISSEGFQTIHDTIDVSDKKVFFEWNLEKLQSQWLVITSQPDGADVYLNDQPVGKTTYQSEMLVGRYKWKLKKELYLPDSGVIELKPTKKSVLDVALKQNYSSINISSLPPGAFVNLNGNDITGVVTPCTIEKVPAGLCTVTLRLPKYGSKSETFQLNAGLTKDIKLELSPDFGTINLSTSPENGASVSLNGIPTNKVTSCMLEVNAGESTVTVSMNDYETTTQKMTVSAGEIKDLVISMKPTFAFVKINSDPACEIYINETLKGNGTWQGRLNPGVYTIEGKRDKFITNPVKQTITIGEPVEITLYPKPITGSLKVITNPIDVTINVDGKNHGTTPVTIPGLLVGEYKLTLEKPGYGTVVKQVVIKDSQVTEVNEKLVTGLDVEIRSNPGDAALTIDDKSMGKTNQSVFLTFGKHQIRLQKMGYEDYHQTIVVDYGKTSFDFILKPIGKEVYFKSNPGGATVSIDGGESKTTPGKVFIKQGLHNFTVEKPGFRTRKGVINGDNKRKRKFVNLKPSDAYGLGVIFAEGAMGGEIYGWGKIGLVVSYMDISSTGNIDFDHYSSYAFSIQSGVRIIYPIEFMLHAGYGKREFTNDDDDQTKRFETPVIGATLPLRLSKKFGFYGKIDYWFKTEKDPITLYSVGFVF